MVGSLNVLSVNSTDNGIVNVTGEDERWSSVRAIVLPKILCRIILGIELMLEPILWHVLI